MIHLIFNIEQKAGTMEEPWKECRFIGSRKIELPYKQLQWVLDLFFLLSNNKNMKVIIINDLD